MPPCTPKHSLIQPTLHPGRMHAGDTSLRQRPASHVLLVAVALAAAALALPFTWNVHALGAANASAPFTLLACLTYMLNICHLTPCVLLQATVLSLYPLHFFFVPLYYTDVGALTWLLLAYVVRCCDLPITCLLPALFLLPPHTITLQLCLERQYVLTTVATALAVSFRQTNAIWAAWLLAVGC